MRDFAQTYTAFRASRTFLLGLCALVAMWLAAHFLFGFDREFGDLNLTLSAEASISLALFAMVADAQDRAQRRQAQSIAKVVSDVQRVCTVLLDMAEAQRIVLEDNARALRERQT